MDSFISCNLFSGFYRYHLGRKLLDTIQMPDSFIPRLTINEPDKIWFFDNYQLLCFAKKDYSFKTFDFHHYINDFRMDSAYLYLCTANSFRIYNRKFIDSHLISLTTLLDKRARDTKVLDSLALPDSLSFMEVYRLNKSLKSKYNILNDAVQSRIHSLFYSSYYYIQSGDPAQLEGLLQYVKDSVTETDIKRSCYKSLIDLSNFNGKLKKTLRIDSVLSVSHPDFRDEYHCKRMVEVSKAYKKLCSIQSSQYKRDRFLWETGKVYYDLFQHVGPVGECSYIMTFPFLFLDSLLKLYPKSSYADNAAFLKLQHLEGSSHEGGDDSFNMEAIQLYQAFIDKYPDTELMPDLLLKISELYFWHGTSGKQKVKECKLALKNIDKIINEFPSFASKHNIIELKKEVTTAISDLAWDFSIRTNKAEYETTEPVFVTVFLKNTGTVPKAIKVPSNKTFPSFTVWIKWHSFNNREEYGGLSFIEELNFHTLETIDSIIQPGEIYTETQCLTRRFLQNCGNQYGKYVFLKEGVCKLGVHTCDLGQNLNIYSDTITFKMIKKRQKTKM